LQPWHAAPRKGRLMWRVEVCLWGEYLRLGAQEQEAAEQ